MSAPLYLLRHGPTAASRRGAPLGRMDLPVEPEGQAQWPKVRAALLGLGIQSILTSDLRRAGDHARELAEELDRPVQVLPALAEQDFGAWDGQPWSEIRGAETFFADPVNTAPPDGESFATCGKRTLLGLAGVPTDQPLLILAHAGPLRAILAHHLGLPLDRALDLAWDPFGLSRVDLYARGRGLLVFHNQAPGCLRDHAGHPVPS